MSKGYKYQDWENQIIKDWFPIEGSKECHKRLPHRTLVAIKQQAQKLNVKGKRGQRFKGLTGNIYGIYEVIRRGDDYISPTGQPYVRWEIKCTKCGATAFAYATSLKRGKFMCCNNCPQLQIGNLYNQWLEPVERVEDYINLKVVSTINNLE